MVVLSIVTNYRLILISALWVISTTAWRLANLLFVFFHLNLCFNLSLPRVTDQKDKDMEEGLEVKG